MKSSDAAVDDTSDDSSVEDTEETRSAIKARTAYSCVQIIKVRMRITKHLILK